MKYEKKSNEGYGMTTFTLGVFHIFRVPYNTTLFWSHFNSFLKYTSLEDDIEDHATQTNRTEVRKLINIGTFLNQFL